MPQPSPSSDLPRDWLRGVLELAVLRVVSDGPTYGYAISESLTEGGFGEVKGGTLYPLLGRLEESGQVTSTWRAGDGGPGRKYYALTDGGRQRLRTEATAWVRFAEHVAAFITTPERQDARP